MEEFIAVVTSYPTIVFTVGMVFVVVFWMLSLIGIVDIEMFDMGFDFDLDIDADADAGGFADLSGLLMYFGLNGIPITIVISFLMLVAWVLSYFASAYLIAPLPFDWLRYVAGTLVIAGVLAVALPITGMSLKPTRHLFAGATAKTKASFVGYKGVITTLEVSDTFGQVEVADGGAGLLVDARADVPNDLTRGDEVALLSYDEAGGCYRVMSDKEFMQL